VPGFIKNLFGKQCVCVHTCQNLVRGNP